MHDSLMYCSEFGKRLRRKFEIFLRGHQIPGAMPQAKSEVAP